MRFDIGWSDLAYGISATGRPLDRRRLEWEIRHYWPHPELMFPCLSVRTGFDLFWTVVGLPAGSEVLMTALTIPDMPRSATILRAAPGRRWFRRIWTLIATCA